jgi:uncharacterized membrane protein HdeD (DUF308 family)
MEQETSNSRQGQYWWVPLLFGVILVLIGIWILRSPEESFEKITKIIGVIILISGTSQLIFTLAYRKMVPGWGFQLAGNLFDLAIGIILILDPTILLKVITLFVGAWFIINSISILARAVQSRRKDQGYRTWELGLGILFLILAAIILWHPMIIGLTIAIWTAIAFIVLGIFRIVLTIRLKRQRG